MAGEVVVIEQASPQVREDSNRDHTDNKAMEHVRKSDTGSPKNDDSNADNVSNDVVDISCGIGGLRTNLFGRKFANLYSFCICFGIANLFALMVGQVIQVQLTSLERQFNIDNTQAGLFETVSRIGFISTLLFAGHFAKKYHIPMIIGAAGVIQGLVLSIPAIMQLVDPFVLPVLSEESVNSSVATGESVQYVCNTLGRNDTESGSSGQVKHLQFIMVLVVQTIKGLTDTFHNGFLPILYMDDNMLDKSQMGIMLGIWQILSELSGPIGKQINGVLSEVPIDLIPTTMMPDDRRFVAAWWLAFLSLGIGTALFSFPIMLFPRSLVSERQKKDALRKAVVSFAGGQVEEEVVVEVGLEDLEEEEPESETQTKSATESDVNDLEQSAKRRQSVSTIYSRSNSKTSAGKRGGSTRRRSSLFPPVVGPTERRVSITGDLIFEQPIKQQDSLKEESLSDLLKDFPQALKRVLGKPVIFLSLIDIAIISIPYSGTAIFRNAYMVNEYNVTMSEVAYVTGITTAIGTIAGTVLSSWLASKASTKLGYSLISCCTWFVTLIIIPFFFVYGCDNQAVYGAPGEYGREANISDCNCTLSSQLISCGDDGNNYISPCYAGCSGVNGKHFTECLLTNVTLGSTVTPGLCATDCHTNFIIYATLQGALNFFFAMSMIPRRLLILRIVDPQDRGFATSLFNFFFVLTGIPSTNIFGKVIDGTCLIWDDNLCTLYDRDKIRYLMSGIDLSVHTCVQITFLLMVIIFKCEEMKVKKGEQQRQRAKEIEIAFTSIQ